MNAKKFRKDQIDTMLAHLKMALGYCNIYQDIISLQYDPDKEIVICAYAGPAYGDASNRPIYKLEINVACDSNSAMIKDVVERLDKFFRIGGIMKDYQLRFCYEYYDLRKKTSKLEDLLFKAHNSKLDFELNCPLELLQQQYLTMCAYMRILESRASFEHINLEEWCNDN